MKRKEKEKRAQGEELTDTEAGQGNAKRSKGETFDRPLALVLDDIQRRRHQRDPFAAGLSSFGLSSFEEVIRNEKGDNFSLNEAVELATLNIELRSEILRVQEQELYKKTLQAVKTFSLQQKKSAKGDENETKKIKVKRAPSSEVLMSRFNETQGQLRDVQKKAQEEGNHRAIVDWNDIDRKARGLKSTIKLVKFPSPDDSPMIADSLPPVSYFMQEFEQGRSISQSYWFQNYLRKLSSGVSEGVQAPLPSEILDILHSPELRLPEELFPPILSSKEPTPDLEVEAMDLDQEVPFVDEDPMQIAEADAPDRPFDGSEGLPKGSRKNSRQKEQPPETEESLPNEKIKKKGGNARTLEVKRVNSIIDFNDPFEWPKQKGPRRAMKYKKEHELLRASVKANQLQFQRVGGTAQKGQALSSSELTLRRAIAQSNLGLFLSDLLSDHSQRIDEYLSHVNNDFEEFGLRLVGSSEVPVEMDEDHAFEINPFDGCDSIFISEAQPFRTPSKSPEELKEKENQTLSFVQMLFQSAFKGEHVSKTTAMEKAISAIASAVQRKGNLPFNELMALTNARLHTLGEGALSRNRMFIALVQFAHNQNGSHTLLRDNFQGFDVEIRNQEQGETLRLCLCPPQTQE